MARLPNTLWKNDLLFMAPTVLAAFCDEVNLRGLMQKACEPHSEDEIFGGESDELTLTHFAQRFVGSYARAAFVATSPLSQFETVSHHLLASIFDGSVAILDIPCGSGGGLHGLLSSVMELRSNHLLPRTPIEIDIFGGDISPLAREIHEAMLNRVRADYAKLGLRLSWSHRHWDVMDPMKTADFLDEWVKKTADFEEHLVFVSAFSGFAKDHQEDVFQAIRDITVRLRSKMLHIVWIEPDMKVVKGIFKGIYDKFKGWFSSDTSLKTSLYTDSAEFNFQHPFVDRRHTGRARVVTFQRF